MIINSLNDRVYFRFLNEEIKVMRDCSDLAYWHILMKNNCTRSKDPCIEAEDTLWTQILPWFKVKTYPQIKIPSMEAESIVRTRLNRNDIQFDLDIGDMTLVQIVMHPWVKKNTFLKDPSIEKHTV